MNFLRISLMLCLWSIAPSRGAHASESNNRFANVKHRFCTEEASLFRHELDNVQDREARNRAAIERNNNAVLLMNTNEIDAALDEFHKIDTNVLLPEIAARVLLNRGIVEERLGRPICAITYFLQALETDPTYSLATESIGRSILSLRSEEMLEYTPMAVESFIANGELTAARVLLERVLQEAGASHSLLSIMVKYFSAARVNATEYVDRWRPLLIHHEAPTNDDATFSNTGRKRRSSPDNELILASVETIDAVYLSAFDLRSRLDDIPKYRLWRSEEDRSRLAALLELVADQAYQANAPMAAASRYRLASLEEIGRADAHEAMVDSMLFNRSPASWAPESPPSAKEIEKLARERREKLLKGIGPAYQNAGILYNVAEGVCANLVYSIDIYDSRRQLDDESDEIATFARQVNFAKLASEASNATKAFIRHESGIRDHGLEERDLDDAIRMLEGIGRTRRLHDSLETIVALDQEVRLTPQAMNVIRECVDTGALRKDHDTEYQNLKDNSILGKINGHIRLEGQTEIDKVQIVLASVGLRKEEKIKTVNSLREFYFYFEDLAPGKYAIYISIENSQDSWVFRYSNVEVKGSFATRVEDTIDLSFHSITVTSVVPFIEERTVTIVREFGVVEFEKLPSSRDPWAVLRIVPGVQTDRIDVGGNESGRQVSYTGPASTSDQAVWAVDGVVITDMKAIGSSPSYYNFDAFEEIQVATGGSDASLATGGVTINMVTRRGTNTWRGSGRFLIATDELLSSLDVPLSDFGRDFDGQGPTQAQKAFKQGNRIVSVKDWGGEFGGPLVRDMLWVWSNYGRNDIDLLAADDRPKNSKLQEYGGKVNHQASTGNSLVLFYNRGDDTGSGREASLLRPHLTTRKERRRTSIYRVEDTHVFSSSLFLSALATHVEDNRILDPQGGLDGPPPLWDNDFIWQNNFIYYGADQPQRQVKMEGNLFAESGNLSHDLKFGVGYRQVALESTSIFPGGGLRLDGLQSLGTPFPLFRVSRNPTNNEDIEYTSAFVQDTLTTGNLTINLGMRYDNQTGHLKSVRLNGVPGFESVIPDAITPAMDQGFTWDDVVLRLGLTYSLGKDRDTLLRASLGRFADQLGHDLTATIGPGSAGAYAYYYYEDTDGDGFVAPSEIIDFEAGPVFTNGFDAAAQSSNNIVDHRLDAPLRDELILGVEHAVETNLVVGAYVTLRKVHDLLEREVLLDDNGAIRPHRRDDYILNDIIHTRRPDGSVFPVQVYRPKLPDTGGVFLSNGERSQDFRSLVFIFNRRLDGRWMLRGNVTLQDWRWRIPESELENPNMELGGGDIDGGRVFQAPSMFSSAKEGVYINVSWSYSLTGLFQIASAKGWSLKLSGALHGREGYPIPYYVLVSRVLASEATTSLQATNMVDEFRAHDVHVLDLRLENDIDIGKFNCEIGFELFNVFNSNVTLQRRNLLGVSDSDHVFEVLSPRVWRVGLRFRF